jgi:zinc transporter 2
MSDAAHLLSDFLGFLISIISIYISRQTASKTMSFGYHRSEVLGALVSVNIIWGLTIWLFYEATYRIFNPRPVNGFVMLITGILGLLFNVIMGLVLMYYGIDHSLHNHDHDHDHHHHEKFDEHHHFKNKNGLDHSHDHGHDHNHDHGHDHNHDNDHGHDHNHDQDHKHSNLDYLNRSWIRFKDKKAKK